MTFFAFRVHFILAAASFIACLRPSVLDTVVRLSWEMRLSLVCFFALTGVSQVLLLTGDGNSTGSSVLDIGRIVALCALVLFTYLDQKRAVKRLANALALIRDEFDGLAVVRGAKGRALQDSGDAEWLNVGDAVAATISHALLAADGEEPTGDALP